MNKKKKTIEYYLGVMIGEYIVTNYLPTLSTDMIKSSVVIEVSDEDTIEYKKLEGDWHNHSKDDKDGRKEKFKIHLKHMYKIGGKYLPHTLEMRIPKFGIHLITDMKEFKNGLSDTLWNCDMCSYDIEYNKIEIRETEDYAWCDYITLHLDEKYLK